MDNTFNDELEVQTFGYLEYDRGHIRDLALECGFTLKPQADGRMDLNDYVYAFADALRSELLSRAVSDMENERHYCEPDNRCARCIESMGGTICY